MALFTVALLLVAPRAAVAQAKPTITTQPQSQTVFAGTNVSFTVTASGQTPFSYLWSLNGTNLASGARVSGVTTATLTISNVVTGDAGNYRVVVSNSHGTDTSSNALLTVNSIVCTPPPSGLVGWWQAENNGSDSASTNTALLQNGASFAAGKVGQAFSFDGVNDFARVNKTPSLDVGAQGTIEFWMKADPSNAMTTYQGLLTSDFFAIEISNGFVIGPKGVNFVISTDGGASETTFSYPTTADVNGGGAVVSAGVWHHVAGTYDGAKLQLYIDGQPWGNPSFHSGAISPMLANSFVAIGSEDGRTTCPSCPGSRYFNGLIDEPAIYNRALSAAEIAAIYNSSYLGKCPLPPIIVQSPPSRTNFAGESTVLAATVTGSAVLAYHGILMAHRSWTARASPARTATG